MTDLFNKVASGRHFCVLLIAVALLSGCRSKAPDKPVKVSPKQFTGEWESVSLEIRMHSFGGIPDSTVTLTADSTNWVEILNMLPIRTVFRMDQSYFALYRNPDSSVLSKTSGFFELKGRDSLIIHKQQPNKETIRHAWVKKDADTYGFIGIVDFDGDGQIDDEMFALNRRVAY